MRGRFEREAKAMVWLFVAPPLVAIFVTLVVLWVRGMPGAEQAPTVHVEEAAHE